MPERNLVFVVDDDAMMLRSVARLLRQSGYVSLLFPSAEAFQDHDDFEAAICIILDINLADQSGIELRRRLRAAGISVPVIFITGNEHASRPDGSAGIRMPSLSHKAVHREIADRATRKGIGGNRLVPVRRRSFFSPSLVDILLKGLLWNPLPDRRELAERH